MGIYNVKNKWFKHYNTAHEGQMIGDLILTGKHEAALLVYIIMELISRFETDEARGFASIPVERLARAMNMKPSKIDRLIAEICSVSRSDLVCETSEEQPRNRSFLMRNWLELQETRGGKREAKIEQKPDRSKKLEVRSKNTPIVPMVAEAPKFDFELVYQKYPRKEGKAKAIVVLKQTIKNQYDFELLGKAIENYCQHIANTRTEKKFIKHFSSFVGTKAAQSWRDWLDVEEPKQTNALGLEPV